MGATPERAGEEGREAAFRWRGGSVSRIEGLTDGVFALALTLLVVTLEVPSNYKDMIIAFRQVPVFALTFASIGLLWYQHHLFHRRYGLEDFVTVVWNLVFLFLVLLYAYPLKFLARALCQMSGIVPHDDLEDGFVAEGLRVEDLRGVMLLYSGGVVAIFLVLAAMVRHAEKRADDLGLDARERILTRSTLRDHLLAAGIGAVSFLMAASSPGLVSLSGMLYFAFGPILAWNGWRTERELKALEAGAGGGSAGEVGAPPAKS